MWLYSKTKGGMMKNKILALGLVCLFFMFCAQKVNEDQAEEIIRAAFELTEKDTVEILGISMETKKEAIVKFNLNEVQISSKMRRYDTGWQLDEIQNDFGMWVPAENLAKMFSQPEKQKATMRDMASISTALADYITDNGIAPEQEGAYSEESDFYSSLSPFYIKILPIKDSWGNNFMVYCGEVCNGIYGATGCGRDDFIVVSYGRDGQKEDWEYNTADPNAGLFIIESADDFDKDLVVWNGSWIRAPRIGK